MHASTVEIEKRLQEVLVQLTTVAEERSGAGERMEVKSTEPTGQLGRLLREAISDLSFCREAVVDRVEQLEQLVEQRTKRLDEEIAARENVEDELRASHRHYQTMVEAITDYVVTIHVEGGKQVGATHGPGCVAVTGYTAEEFRQHPYLWIDMVAEEDREFVRHRTARTLSERNAKPFEHRIVTKGGRVRWVRHTPVLQIGNDGELLACDSLIQDVTARKLAELHLQASEEQKSLALQGGDLGTWDWNVASGHIEFNCRWAEMLGYTLDALQPKVDTWKRLIHPADRRQVEDALERHLSGETSSYETQHRLRHESGDWIWVLAKGRVLSRDSHGKPLRACGTHLDITERKQAEEQLRITQFSVDKAPEMVIWLEANAQVHYVNEATCKLLGYSAEEMIGNSVWSLCPEWPEERYLSEPERLAAHGPLNFDMKFRHKDGDVIPVEVTVNELRYDRGRSYYCVSGRDIRERARTMAALREARIKAEAATRAKTEFLATMSHEIRTPLTAILGYTDALRCCGDIRRAPSSRIKMLSAIRRNGSHLVDLISDLLDLSQIEAEHLELAPTATSPLKLVLEVAANMLERAESKGLSLSVECPTPIPVQVQTDPKRLRQILTNLIGNAIKFTSAGHVKIRLTTQDADSASPYLAVAVEDTGSGVPAEKQGEIFEPFTHGHDRHVRHTAGTGLGLAICQRLVAASGGDISLQSEVDKGSVFTFTLPVPPNSTLWQPRAGDLAIDQIPDAGEGIPDVDLSGRRVLIVEDAPDTQDFLTLFLEEAGATVDLASNGIDGVKAGIGANQSGSPYDLILMDMRIPGISGHAATRRLRDAGLGCPIVALTAHAMKNDEQACLDAGCAAYATKPIDLRSLFETIERLLPASRSPTSSSANVPHDSPVRMQPLVSEKVGDARFQPLLDRFIARLPETRDRLRSARQAKKLDVLLTVVHRLRGTAANYGFPQITAVADKCEIALRNRNQPQRELDESLDELATLVQMAIDAHRHGEDNRCH